MTTVRLNIGAGGTIIPGYTPIDIKDGVEAGKLPYADESVDEIYASHVLEHIPHARTALVLQEWRRVLKPGGVVRIGVPDFNKLKEQDFDAPDGGWALHVLMGGHTDEHDIHHIQFTFNGLANRLQQLGFEDVREFKPFANDCTQHPMSLNVEAFKRQYAKPHTPKICIGMSVGRLGFFDQFQCMNKIIAETGWPVLSNQSAFWEKGMSLVIEDAIERGFDYVLFTDYDGLYEPRDAQELVRRLHESDAAVMYAVQMSRHDHKPLCFEHDADYSGPQTVKKFAHFGLTAVRLEIFKKFPQPWFENIPGPDGSWRSNPHSDADISFWRRLQLMGHKVVQCNDIVIGHMEVCAIWPTKQGRMIQPLPLYRQVGKPKQVEFSAAAFLPKPPAPPVEPPKEAAIATDVHG
jgi:predicted SAM-dependent methyltransferase